MSYETTSPKPKPERKLLSRSQRIAVIILATPFGLTTAGFAYAILRAKDTTGIVSVLGQWVSFVSAYVPLGLGVLLGGGAVVKSARAVADGMASRKS